MVEPPHIFDPRRNMHVQGFSGRAATTTVHDATETALSISGIFQAAADFAVPCLYNAYDYFNHVRLEHLPQTDLPASGSSSTSSTVTPSTARCALTPPSSPPSPGTQ